MNNYFTGIIILVFSGIIASVFSKRYKLFILSLLAAVGSVFCIIPAVQMLVTGNNLVTEIQKETLFGNINFIIDPLSAFFIIVISIMSLVSVIYSNGYLKSYIELKNINSHIVILPVLTAAMLAVVTCQNALLFIIFWEIMSLSSFFLVIFESTKKDVLKAGIKYLVFMHISVIFIILSFTLMSIKAGSFDFNSFKLILEENSNFSNLIFILAFAGFGIKAGLVPFHNWLPDAHPAAPSHVSAVMSGIMIKTGFYGILRIITLIGSPSKIIAFIVLTISIISILYGVLYAITQQDIKRLLAYSSIENIGIIGTGIGLGMFGLAYQNPIVAIAGFSGGILHILNHSIFKELLFLAAGSIYTQTHTKNIEILGGMIKVMPITAIMFLVGSVAICGLPPFNGFISEFLIYFGMFKGLNIHIFASILVLLFAISALAFVGTMAILCFTKAFSIIFLGLPRSEKAEKIKKDSSTSMIFSMSILAIFALTIGILPQYVLVFIQKIVLGILPTGISLTQIFEKPLELMQIISFTSIAFIITTIVLILLKIKLSNNKICMNETWGCGYNKANNHMQYTGSSYASPFLSMLKPLFKNVFDIEKPKHLFPKKAHFNLEIEDIEEAYFIKPIVKIDEWFLSKFETMQSGNIQSYIKYGLIFLLTVIIGSFFIG